jgi:LAO/AO transport system kinase
MAARGRLGGVAEVTFPAVVLLRACFDWVVVETVGVGQSETEVADCADIVVLCVQPGSGDAVQFMKSGVTEVPDLVLVTKGDLGTAATRAAADVRGALSLYADAAAQVAVVSSVSGDGIAGAVEAIRTRRAAMSGPALAARRAAQARRWSESRLVESFGREGLALLTVEGAAGDDPFSGLARVTSRFRDLLHKVSKEL